jgi:hypothetical protein
MAFCPDCGAELHNCQADQPDPVAEAARAETKVAKTYTDAEVEVARIQAERDVAVAKVQAGIIKDEVVVEAAMAEAEAEGVVEALAPEPEPEPEPVIIVDADADAGAEPEPSIPEAADQGEPVTATSSSKNPWW